MGNPRSVLATCMKKPTRILNSTEFCGSFTLYVWYVLLSLSKIKSSQLRDENVNFVVGCGCTLRTYET